MSAATLTGYWQTDDRRPETDIERKAVNRDYEDASGVIRSFCLSLFFSLSKNKIRTIRKEVNDYEKRSYV